MGGARLSYKGFDIIVSTEKDGYKSRIFAYQFKKGRGEIASFSRCSSNTEAFDIAKNWIDRAKIVHGLPSAQSRFLK